NGVIIGTTLFGIGLCFVQMFQLLPEYKWLHGYTSGKRRLALPPHLLRPVAQMLSSRPRQISASTLNGMMEMILLRFEDSRESVRYITNTLIFLGLLGTFWGLILTVGGFAELIGGLNFSDENVLNSMQAGLTRPLAGMATAFTSSLLGLGGSLTVGFLALQVQSAQNTIYHELQDYLSAHTHPATTVSISDILSPIKPSEQDTK
ncbi:MAG: flagellar motor protein MotA, partial [Alphaproteobacteria bacterium]|nr:flagellar motor protein MotA [Alphaproteobacteria bacterium]